jgi:hypothetical protein
MTRKKLLTRSILLSGVMKNVRKSKNSMPFIWKRPELAVKRSILQEMGVRLLSREDAKTEGLVVIRGSRPVVHVIDNNRTFVEDLFVLGAQTKPRTRSAGDGSIGVQQDLFSREPR